MLILASSQNLHPHHHLSIAVMVVVTTIYTAPKVCRYQKPDAAAAAHLQQASPHAYAPGRHKHHMIACGLSHQTLSTGVDIQSKFGKRNVSEM